MFADVLQSLCRVASQGNGQVAVLQSVGLVPEQIISYVQPIIQVARAWKDLHANLCNPLALGGVAVCDGSAG